MNRVLLDTGPLVAIISDKDQHHDDCVAELRKLTPPLFTCWPVITEAAWLLRTDRDAVERMLTGFDVGLLKLLPLEEQTAPWISQFFRRYSNLEPQLADACLVYLAEHERIDRIFTLDRRDFSIYRFGDDRSFTLIPSPAARKGTAR